MSLLLIGLAGAIGYVIGKAQPTPTRGEASVIEPARAPVIPFHDRVALPANGWAPPASAVIPTAEPAPPPPPDPAERREIATAEVQASLETMRSRLVDLCRPGPSSPPSGKTTVTIQLSFDAEGREVGRGISEGSGADPVVVECLRRVTDMPLAVSAFGANVDVETALTLP